MILIRDNLVIDGTGKPPERLDILLKDDKISALGHFKNIDAEIVIDGMGLTTAPGFIDINTDSDHYLSLFTDPAQQDFLLQGVTTIIGGHCGSSLAPLLYGGLESVRKWGDTSGVNVDWKTVAEFLKILERRKLGVNFGTLVGHSTIRRALIGNDQRDLTAREQQVFTVILKQALEDGALGLSTGLGYSHGKGASYAEIKKLAEVVKKYRGVYGTHLRNEREQVGSAVEEAIRLATETGVETLISHFRPIVGFEKEFTAALKKIEASDPPIHFDAYPFNYSMLAIYTLLPDWLQGGSLEQMQDRLTEKHGQEEAMKAIADFKGDDLVIARASGFDYLVGKTLKHFAASRGIKNIKKALINLMLITRLKAVLFYRNVNLEMALDSLLSKSAFVASNSPSLVDGKNILENERATKTFSTFLNFAAKSKKINLESAIEKITSQPAKTFRLTDRGVIKEGMTADLVMLSDNKAVNVFISGQLAVKDGKFQNILAGKILRRQ